ncbi:MAG: Hsp20/alpha crystallin family protein [Candidatus Poribacteria bacterium]|nr:Hsp20/alpha crystallin family protein [Candidatus Poribacteria bacterium]
MRSNPSRLIDHFFEMQKEIDRLFDDFVQPSQDIATETTHWCPPMDIYETVDNFVIKVEIAGIEPGEDVTIHLDRNILTIKGYRQDRTALKKEHYHQAELNYGPFERSIVLPNVLAEDVEPMASYENGFLEIYIPKAKPNRPKEIVIQVKDELEAAPSENTELQELDDGKAE